MLFDTASLYFRAFYGLPATLRSPAGTPVNAVRGLLDFLARFIDGYRPDQVACCWDASWRPVWRVALIDSYKAHRVAHDDVEDVPEDLMAQVPLIRAVLNALGIAIVEADGYEADDVMGSLAQLSTNAVDVVTGDRDLFQLVDDQRRVRVLYVGRGVARHEQVDAAWVRDRYGIDPDRYIDFAVLRGDPSDGLPGVAGIGEKTAARLIDQYGDLEHILAAADHGRLPAAVAARLSAAVGYLGPAQEVVRVHRGLDLASVDLALPPVPAHPADFSRLTAELNLGGSAGRIIGALAAAGDAHRERT